MSDKWWDGLSPESKARFQGTQAALRQEVAARDDRILVLEAKLAKALEMALEGCPFYWGSGSHNDWWQERRATVAALEGEWQ